MAKIKPQGSVKVVIQDGKLQTSNITIEGWLSIDYNKYMAGYSLMDCLILSESNEISNFPVPD